MHTKATRILKDAGRAVLCVAVATAVASACGDDSDNASLEDDVSNAATCQELLDAFEPDDITDDEARLISDTMWAIATDDVADDGVLDESVACNTVIRDLDVEHPGAVENLKLDELAAGQNAESTAE